MYKKSFFISTNTSRDFNLIFKKFLKNSLILSNLINCTDLSNYDFDGETIKNREKEYLENKKMIICKFYYHVIIKIIMEDLKALINRRFSNY
jgi:hypothetical protein